MEGKQPLGRDGMPMCVLMHHITKTEVRVNVSRGTARCWALLYLFIIKGNILENLLDMCTMDISLTNKMEGILFGSKLLLKLLFLIARVTNSEVMFFFLKIRQDVFHDEYNEKYIKYKRGLSNINSF